MVALCVSVSFTCITYIGYFIQGHDSVVPWAMLSNGGIGITLLFAIWMFMRFLREERTDRTAERTQVQAVMKDMNETFVQRVEASNARVEASVRDLAQSVRQTQGPPRGSLTA